MKAIKVLIIAAAMAVMVFFIPTMAFAGGHGHGHHGHGHSDVSVGIGIGVPIYGGCGYWDPYPYYYPYYSYYPYYQGVVYAPPPCYAPVVVTRPAVVRRSVIVGPAITQPSYNSDLSSVRIRKTQLLEQLKRPDESERMQAISELAGFSFDDQVRAALENLLLTDPSAEIRKEVTVSFGKVKNHAALTVLEKVRVEDSDVEVRAAADKAINMIKS